MKTTPLLISLLLLCPDLLPAVEPVSTPTPSSTEQIKRADQALLQRPLSVTQKSKVAPSGNPHDYASTAPYFWPDPAKPNGKPYIRHDGKINPESRTAASDIERAGTMSRTVGTLTRAYELTHEEKYAAHAALLLRTWFLDPKTHMTPHLNYAQGIPGLNDGRQIGIIEGTTIVSALENGQRLAGSASWTAADQAALMQWTAQFLDWYLTSPFGLKERDGKNNHGTHYDVQIMRMGLMLGRTDFVREVAEMAKLKRIAAQIEPDGRQPHELERTASFSYSSMNLSGMVNVAQLAEKVGVNLWHFETADGRSIRKAIDFLVPYLEDPSKKWPYEQIKGMNRSRLSPVLRQAALAYHEPLYEKLAAKLDAMHDDKEE